MAWCSEIRSRRMSWPLCSVHDPHKWPTFQGQMTHLYTHYCTDAYTHLKTLHELANVFLQFFIILNSQDRFLQKPHISWSYVAEPGIIDSLRKTRPNSEPEHKIHHIVAWNAQCSIFWSGTLMPKHVLVVKDDNHSLHATFCWQLFGILWRTSWVPCFSWPRKQRATVLSI